MKIPEEFEIELHTTQERDRETKTTDSREADIQQRDRACILPTWTKNEWIWIPAFFDKNWRKMRIVYYFRKINNAHFAPFLVKKKEREFIFTDHFHFLFMKEECKLLVSFPVWSTVKGVLDKTINTSHWNICNVDSIIFNYKSHIYTQIYTINYKN